MKNVDIKLNAGEGAIVFRGDGVEFYYPEGGPVDLRDTFEFLTFAMLKADWLAEWYEYLASAEALKDLAGEAEKPNLRLIVGGKSDDES